MAEDPELAKIRAQRMAEMQSQAGNPQQMQQQQEKVQREKEMKNMMLGQILDQGARARLNSIALVKPEKAVMVENMLIQMARSGQIGGKLSEEGLVGLLGKVNQQIDSSKKVTITRRRYAMDSDSDDN